MIPSMRAPQRPLEHNLRPSNPVMPSSYSLAVLRPAYTEFTYPAPSTSAAFLEGTNGMVSVARPRNGRYVMSSLGARLAFVLPT